MFNINSMNTKNNILLLSTLSIMNLHAGIKPKDKTQPNILYIFTDDQSFRTVSAYPEAYEWVRTPNIDKLGTEGMRFSNFYAGTWSMASRATALTGLHSHGINSLRMEGPYPGNEYNPEVLRFWPSVFRENGYYTGIVGKWHTGSDDGAGRDWDYSAVWNHAAGGNGGYFVNQKISFHGNEPIAVGGYSTDNYTNYAIEFIDGRAESKDQPWYLWLCYDAPHKPCIHADRHKDDYVNTPPVPVPDDIFPPRPGKPSHMVNYNYWWEKDQEGNPLTRWKKDGKQLSFDDFIRMYNRSILPIDEGVGKILEALKSTGQLDNTIIVFTSDQGYAIGQHGFSWKYAPYDATLKAPLLIRWPEKISSGQVCEHPVGGHDLIATFFSVAGIELPWKMHGHDITPMLEEPDCQWDKPLLLVNTQRLYGVDTNRGDFPIHRGIPSWVSLREKNYKYIRHLIEDEIEELYDLEKDPGELINLSLSPDYEGLLEDMRQKMIAELKRTDAGFVDKLPAIKTY